MGNSDGSTVSQLQKFLGRQGAHAIGALAYWSLSGVDLGRDEFGDALKGIGLGAAIQRLPRPEALLSKAVDSVKAGLKAHYFRRLGRYEFAVMREVKQPDGRLEGRHVATVSVDKGNATTGAAVEVMYHQDPNADPSAAFPLPGDAELCARVLTRFDHYTHRIDTEEMSATIVRALHGTYREPMLAAVSLRERTGGLYFVPAGSITTLQALSEYVQTSSPSSFATFTLYSDEANLKQAAEAAGRDFRSQLATVQAEADEFVAKLKDSGEQANERNLEVRLRQFDAIKDKLALWSEVLGDTKTELDAQLESAKSLLAKQLGL